MLPWKIALISIPESLLFASCQDFVLSDCDGYGTISSILRDVNAVREVEHRLEGIVVVVFAVYHIAAVGLQCALSTDSFKLCTDKYTLLTCRGQALARNTVARAEHVI